MLRKFNFDIQVFFIILTCNTSYNPYHIIKNITGLNKTILYYNLQRKAEQKLYSHIYINNTFKTKLKVKKMKTKINHL